MRIKIWTSEDPSCPGIGPYKVLDVLQRDSGYSLGDATHYGVVIAVPPPFALPSEDVDQSVVVKLDPSSPTGASDESIFEPPPTVL